MEEYTDSDGRTRSGEQLPGSNPWFEAQRRRLRISGILSIPFAAVMSLSIYLPGQDSALTAWGVGAGSSLLFVGLVLHGVIVYRRVYATLRIAERSGDMLCFACLYDLGTTLGVGTCPECGQKFTAEELRLGWRRARLRRL